MCKLVFAVPVLLALVLGVARGADDAGGRTPVGPKVNKPKADTEAAKDVEPRAATATKTGTLGEKPVNAADGVIAVLKIKAEPKPVRRERGKKAAPVETKEDTINLMAANPELAVKIKELTARSATVTITGSLLGDTMKVSEVALADDKAAADKKAKPAKAKDQ